MTAAASYVRSHPEEITAPVWYSVGQGAPADIDLAGLPYRIWFGLEGEGPRDGLRSFFSPYNIKFLRDREFETLKARKAYDSGVLSAADPRQSVFLSVAGVNEVKLIVDPNGTTNSDHADWAGARVTGCANSAGGPRKRIGYYPIWDNAGDDLTVTYPQAPASVPWSQITHLNLAFVGILSTQVWHEAFVTPAVKGRGTAIASSTDNIRSSHITPASAASSGP